jgi:3-hydroxyisobutyrate dehydrogenase-like beta-hydroxyacid dehydrogenase
LKDALAASMTPACGGYYRATMSGAHPARSKFTTLAVAGLGDLGAVLVERLRAARFALVRWGRDPSRSRGLGIDAAASPVELGAAALRVVLALEDAVAVEDFIEGPRGFIAASPPPLWTVDLATRDPQRAWGLAARLPGRDVTDVNAALCGSIEALRHGEGVLLAGASVDALEPLRDVLDAIAGVVFGLGGPGKGLEAKLVMDRVVDLNRRALAEGIDLAQKFGISAATMLEAQRAGPAHSRVLETEGYEFLT